MPDSDVKMTDHQNRKVAVVGAGNMGGALVGGAVKGGWNPESITIANRSEKSSSAAAELHGVRSDTLENAVKEADLILLGVKPYQIADVAGAIAPNLPAGSTVLSVAAGTSLATIEKALAAGGAKNVSAVRAMPNTPSLVGVGAAGISAGTEAGTGEMDLVEAFLTGSGIVIRVDEGLLATVAALSGSGPAYVFMVIEAMTDSAVRLGLQRPLAARLALQTVLGSATLLAETGTDATIARQNVTSPGGTTAAALAELHAQGLPNAFDKAMSANVRRSGELA